MNINFSLKNVIITILVLGLIIASFIIGGGLRQREIDRLRNTLYHASDTIKQQSIIINNERLNVFSANAAVVSSQKTLKALTLEYEYLKKLRITDIKTISNLKLEIEVLKKQGEYKDTIIVDTTIVEGSDTVRYAKYRDEWVWANVWLYPEKPQFDLGVHTLPLRVHIGYQGFWRNKPVAVVSSPNPYVILKSNQTIIVDNKKVWQKRYPWLIAGAVAGYLIGR